MYTVWRRNTTRTYSKNSPMRATDAIVRVTSIKFLLLLLLLDCFHRVAITLATNESLHIPARNKLRWRWRGVIMSSSVQVFLRSLESTSALGTGGRWDVTSDFLGTDDSSFPVRTARRASARCVIKIWTAASRRSLWGQSTQSNILFSPSKLALTHSNGARSCR